MPMALLLVLCLAPSFAHASGLVLFPLDIFSNDGKTRTPATGDDLRWTVDMETCTGSMLSPKYLITAHHCGVQAGQTFTSGACLILGCRDDLRVVHVVEQHRDFDSDIAEMAWTRSRSRWAQRYAPRVQTRADELQLGKDGQGTKLFTVGFPADKNKATLAVGYAKRRTGDFLDYNIGTINGNSGGAVWKYDDFTLISQTNHGPHSFGQTGWSGNDPEDSEAWNGGPQMDQLYKVSDVLRNTFPSGRNYNVSFEGYLIHDDVLPPLDP